MPDNGTATIELQVSYYNQKGLSMIVAPFKNWALALDFKYKCRMEKAFYKVTDTDGITSNNALHSCMCRLGGGDDV